MKKQSPLFNRISTDLSYARIAVGVSHCLAIQPAQYIEEDDNEDG